MNDTRRSFKALRLLASYVHEPLDAAAEGAAVAPEAATEETLLLCVRVASSRLVAVTEAGPGVLRSAKAARRWIEARRASFTSPKKG